jgi:hypothetical protein
MGSDPISVCGVCRFVTLTPPTRAGTVAGVMNGRVAAAALVGVTLSVGTSWADGGLSRTDVTTGDLIGVLVVIALSVAALAWLFEKVFRAVKPAAKDPPAIPPARVHRDDA